MVQKSRGTKREKLKAALQAVSTLSLRAEADALFLSIGEGAIVTDSEGKVSRINKVALDILGFKSEKEIIGKWYPETVIAEDESGRVLSNIERPIAEAFISGKPVFKKMYLRRVNGPRVAVALTVSPVIQNGKPTGAIEVFRDITEEVRLDQAKNEFIALASHQLRTPATGVKQYLGMLLGGYAGELTPEQQKLLLVANESNDRQVHIIDDILRVAAADSGDLVLHKEKVDLVELIDQVIKEQASNFASFDQTVSFTHEPAKVHADVDKKAFRSVLENLLDNAHKYTYPGKNVEVVLKQGKSYVQISISDEGVGIEQDKIKDLFQKFTRIYNPLSVSSGGTGLGLYWAKRVIDLHKGTIEVKSKIGKGSTFIIKLYH